MKKEDIIKLGLDDATAEKVAAASAEELKGFIPKARFDEVNTTKTQLETDLKTRDTQLEDLKKSTGDVETLKKTITDLQTANATDKATHEAQILKMQRDGVDVELMTSLKAKNPKAVKGLLEDLDTKLDLESYKTKRKEQIEALTKADDSKFLFDLDTKPGKPNFKGFVPGEHKEGAPGGGDKPKSLSEAIQMRFHADSQQT